MKKQAVDLFLNQFFIETVCLLYHQKKEFIFEQYVHGGELGVNGVARWLEANGYRKKLRGNGKYSLFSAHTVKTIIDNPVESVVMMSK